jgi:GDP-mannose 6-dehydrogenase
VGKGYEVLVFDENVRLANLIGANRDYILNRIPHIAPLLSEDWRSVLEHSEVLVVGNRDPQFREIVRQARNDQFVVDLARVVDRTSDGTRYEGACW